MKKMHDICTVAGCGKPHDAKGFCHAHYNKWKRKGDPLAAPLRAPDGAGWTQKCWICKTYDDISIMSECRRQNGTGYFYHQGCHKKRMSENYFKRKAERNANYV